MCARKTCFSRLNIYFLLCYVLRAASLTLTIYTNFRQNNVWGRSGAVVQSYLKKLNSNGWLLIVALEETFGSSILHLCFRNIFLTVRVILKPPLFRCKKIVIFYLSPFWSDNVSNGCDKRYLFVVARRNQDRSSLMGFRSQTEAFLKSLLAWRSTLKICHTFLNLWIVSHGVIIQTKLFQKYFHMMLLMLNYLANWHLRLLFKCAWD